MTSSAIRCGKAFALLLPLAGSAFGEAVSVGVNEWCASTNTVLPSGWTANGITPYHVKGVQFPKKSDYALSPDYSGPITQVVMCVRSSNLQVQRFLTMTPVIPDLPEEKLQAFPTADKFEFQTFVWDAALGVRQIRFMKEGVDTAGWCISELTIFVDRLDSPRELAVDAEYCDGFAASWEPSEEAVRHEVEVREIVPARGASLARWDFTSLTNTVNATKDLDEIAHGDLGEFSGTNLCLAAYQGGHLQVGKSDKPGALVLPLPDGVGRTCLAELFCAPESTPSGDVYLYAVDGTGATNVLAMPVLSPEKASFAFALPDDAVELQFVSRSKRRIRMTGAEVVSDYVPSSVSTNEPIRVRSRTSSCIVKNLKPRGWQWRVKSFDRRGVESGWSEAARADLEPGDPPRPRPGFQMSLR